MNLDVIKKRWLAYLGIILFIIAKLPHLHYAFYWDESWVYAPAISLMYEHGPSLLPNAIPVDFSRGHPLLYHAACVVWMHIFGNSNFSMHCFALTISTALAIVLYEVMLKLFNQRAALISLALLLVNVIFFAQSSFVLTDISIALLTFLSLCAYVKDQYILTALFLSMLYYTKESGLVAALVFGIDILFSFFTKKTTFKKAAYKSLSLVASITAILLFFIIQKQTLGWYLNPDHTGIINMSIDNTFSNIKLNCFFLFFKEQAYTFFIPLAALLAVASWKQKDRRYVMYLLLAFIVYLGAFVFSPGDLVYYFYVIFLLALLFSFLYKALTSYNTAQARFIKLCIATCAAYTYFNCVNFFEGRYLFPVIFLLCIVLLSVFYEHIVSISVNKLFPYVLALLIGIGINNFRTKGDEMGAYDRMELQQELVDYFVKNDLYNAPTACIPFIERMHLTDAKTGFLHTNKVFNNVTENIEPSSSLVVFDNIEPSDQYAVFNSNHEFTLLRRFENGIAWIEVYKRK